MEIHRATIEEAPLLARLNRRLIIDEGHRNPMSDAQLLSRMKEFLAGEYTAHLFYHGNEPIGYALHRQDTHAIYIRQFFIDANHRRSGYGRAALDELIQRVWSGQRLRIEVLVENEVGISFWKAMAFHPYCLTMEREPPGDSGC